MDLEEQFSVFEMFLEKNHIWFKKNFNIKFETYFKSGGTVRYYCLPKNVNDLITILNYLGSNRMAHKILGFTSNVFLLNEVEYSILISTKHLSKIEVDKDLIKVESGYSLQEFVRVASILNGSKGFEGLEGIPGSIGGAIFMNAGAYGYSISDKIRTVTFIDSEGVVKTVNKEECNFSHRSSLFRNQSDLVILTAEFEMEKGIKSEIAKKIETFHIARHSYQEFAFPNLGSLISVNGDIYREILYSNKSYMIKYRLLEKIYKNSFIKLLKRKRPDNIVFNNLIERFLGRLPFRPSKKSVNILLNTGDNSIEEIFNYVQILSSKLDNSIQIENEFVFDPVISVKKEFSDLYWEMNRFLTNRR